MGALIGAELHECMAAGEAQRVRAGGGAAGALRRHLPHRARLPQARRAEAARLPLPVHPLRQRARALVL